MRAKRRWSAIPAGRGAVCIVCEFQVGDQFGRMVHIISQEEHRRIDYDPWLIVHRMSREVDFFLDDRSRA